MLAAQILQQACGPPLSRQSAARAAAPGSSRRPQALQQQPRPPLAASSSGTAAAASRCRRPDVRAAAASRRPGGASARPGDLGDDLEDMMDRREELLAIRDDPLLDLTEAEEDELDELTESLRESGYLEDVGDEPADVAALLSSVDSEEDDVLNEEEEEGLTDEEADEPLAAAAEYEEGAEQEEQGAAAGGEQAAPAGAAQEAVAEPKGRNASAARAAQNEGIDAIVQQAARGGADDMRLQGMFSTEPAGPAPADDEEVPLSERYPQPPERGYRLPELLRLAGLEEQAASAPDVEVANILTCNSITSSDDSLYVCVPSPEGHDGHEWVDEAVEKGAVAVLAERPLPGSILSDRVVVVPDLPRALGQLAAAFYEHPSRRLRTVGVVGSYGKTVTSWLARGMFEEQQETVGLVGTIEYGLVADRLTEEGELWEPDEEDLTLQRDCSTPFHITPYQGKYPEVPTTPDALHLQKVLAGLADRGATTAILEVDPAVIGDGRLDPVHFDLLVYTNTFADAEEAVGGPEAYADAVGHLFDRLTSQEQIAVINYDDKLGDALAKRVEAAGGSLLNYAVDSRDAEVYAEKVKTSVWETEVLVSTPLGRLQIISHMPGRAAAYNTVAAVAVGIACTLDLTSIVAGIEAVDIIPGRCEVIEERQPFPVVVDSACTPPQLSRLIDEIKEAGARRVLVVLGCPGDTSLEHRAEMARVANFKADAVYLTNDSPGVQWPDEIIADMVAGLPEEVTNKFAGSAYPFLQDPHRVEPWYTKFQLQYQSVVGVYVIEDRFQAIRVAIGMARERDVVLVVGKGHRDYQEYWDGDDWEPEQRTTVKSWFDDRVECRNALSKLGYINGISGLKRDFLPWTRYPDDDRDMLAAEGMVEPGQGEHN